MQESAPDTTVEEIIDANKRRVSDPQPELSSTLPKDLTLDNRELTTVSGEQELGTIPTNVTEHHNTEISNQDTVSIQSNTNTATHEDDSKVSVQTEEQPPETKHEPISQSTDQAIKPHEQSEPKVLVDNVKIATKGFIEDYKQSIKDIKDSNLKLHGELRTKKHELGVNIGWKDPSDEGIKQLQDEISAIQAQIVDNETKIDAKVKAEETEMAPHKDMLKYLDRKPSQDVTYEDIRDDLYHPVEEQKTRHIDNKYEKTPIIGDDGLLEQWAEAIDRNDKTEFIDLQDEILERVINKSDLSDERKQHLLDAIQAKMNRKFQFQSNVEDQPETLIEQVDHNDVKDGLDNQADEAAKMAEEKVSDTESQEQQDNSEAAIADKSIEQKLAEIEEQYQAVIKKYAIAKNNSERLFSRKKSRNKELTAASVDLQIAFERYVKEMRDAMLVVDERKAAYLDLSEMKLENPDECIAKTVIKLGQRVDQAVLDVRANRFSLTNKVSKFIHSHRKTMLLVSATVTGLGFIPPLAPVSVVGRGALRAVGSYELVTTVAEMIASKRLTSKESKTVSEYLRASRNESDFKRRGKRFAAAAALLAATIPGVMSVMSHHSAAAAHTATNGAHHATTNTTGNVTHGAHNTTPNAPGSQAAVPNTTSPTTLHINPVGGNEYPWTFAMNSLHTNISNPEILHQITNNPYGIKFTGNNLGGGQGAITRVTIPGQGSFTDSGHINGAIQYILANRG